MGAPAHKPSSRPPAGEHDAHQPHELVWGGEACSCSVPCAGCVCMYVCLCIYPRAKTKKKQNQFGTSSKTPKTKYKTSCAPAANHPKHPNTQTQKITKIPQTKKIPHLAPSPLFFAPAFCCCFRCSSWGDRVRTPDHLFMCIKCIYLHL